MEIRTILKKLGSDLIDAGTLKTYLQSDGYLRPSDKILRWIKEGELVALKNGLYFIPDTGKLIPRSPLGKIANRLYGPSCVSLQYALSYYGIIPERALSVSSITPIRDKIFQTPLGGFIYRYQKNEIYQESYRLNPEAFLIVTPEKALCDLIYFEKPDFESTSDVESYLTEHLRIELASLRSFSKAEIERLSEVMKRKPIRDFYHFIRGLK